MRLVSLKIEPLGENGWESPLLEFGARTTLLFARNGSGKTPIIQSLAGSLGYPPKFRDEIYGKCAAITLVAENDGEPFFVHRILGANNRDFHAVLSHRGEESEHFSEGSFSIALFKALGLEPPRLVANNGQVAHPFVSTVLPVFYVNQGDGYTAAYKSTSPFISDQFVEMVRFVFGLNPKHSFDVKKDIINEKAALDAQTRKIVAAQRVLEYQSRDIDDSAVNQEILQLRVTDLTGKVDALRDSVDAKGTANATLTELLRQKDQQIQSKQIELSELRSRVSGIDAIRTEIDGEVKTLGLNEEARRVFSSFGEICGVSNCGLFIGSTESYGKNLLYLRDQIKDLDRNASRTEIRIEYITEVLENLRGERQVLTDQLRSPTTAGVDQLVTAVQTLTKQLVEAQAELTHIASLQSERSKLFKLEAERLRIQDRIDNLSNSGRTDFEFNKLRYLLRDLAVKWMDILDAQNVSRNVDIDLNLRFTFDGEPLDLFSGSTQIRLVLAIHAALFEAYISEPSRPFRFLILDTPKQQELHTADLAKYLSALENLCAAKNAQLILSSTEYDHPTGQQDKRWLPTYKGADHPMYLGIKADFIDR
ncbi:hypothetical protein NHH88_04320 [Oxalobacteraceae bacterium OTU3CAMAD1]|nr:hypothetical protein NHH88_04320 [Oxalobacteraceae bacterium OTU3CAMAD1]